jgi:hypothetical protein
MAELLTIDGQEYKKRSPWGAWLLCLTVVYIFIWYYKISKELKQYTAEDSSPGLRLWDAAAARSASAAGPAMPPAPPPVPPAPPPAGL